MTRVHDEQFDGPATHALIIGVGHYEYLSGGSRGAPIEGFDDLGQLGSPPRSAVHLATWLIENAASLAAPLGTVDLLLSPGGETEIAGVGHEIETATYQNISQAIARWFRACDTDRGNVAVLYFAGHGIGRETAAALAQDFGSSRPPLDPFAQALDIGKLQQAMAACRASTQCFFIDTCRQFRRALEGWLALEASCPLPVEIRAMQRDIDAPIVYATAPGRLAYGDPEGLTLFVQALVATLEGLGAKLYDIDEPWKVSTSRLVDGINAWLRYAHLCQQAPEQRCHIDGGSSESTLRHIDGDPHVLLTLKVRPEARAPDSVLSLRRSGREAGPVAGQAAGKTAGQAACYRGTCGDDGWREYILGGDYELDVESREGAFDTRTRPLRALPPPEIIEKVEVS